MSTDRVRFALVGAGTIGQVHAQAIQGLPDVAELRLVVSRRAEPATALAAAHGAEWSTDVDGLWADPDVDAVTICTPTGTHAELAVAALESGKHVMIEKPIELSLAAADRIIAAERASGKKVAVISQHRFDRSFERVAAAVAAGNFGRLTSASASCALWRGQSYYDSAAWRGTWAFDGGGATMNQAIHTIDLLLALLGTPTQLFAYTGRLAHERIETEDTAVAVVTFAGGALATIHATTAAYPGLDTSLCVFGSKGSATIRDDELIFFHGTVGEAPEIAMPVPGSAPNQVTAADALTPEQHLLGDAHVAQFADFVRAVTRDGPVRVGTGDGRAALATILAMYESAVSGRPVRLDGT
ncbi:MAG TPA: Gfo/Idh/MocA family oxidoreductase [Jiangellaceae bacterium]|nr:Gfo/Idh/MocA family oxidoreductase [Jiangellaceae bacterium]